MKKQEDLNVNKIKLCALKTERTQVSICLPCYLKKKLEQIMLLLAIVISKKLQLPLKLVFVRKLGHPINKEFAIGAVTENNLMINNDVFINNKHPEIESLIQKERKRILEMKAKFNHEYNFQEVKQKNILLVDD
jgi:predicted phosphoribosyltransferase